MSVCELRTFRNATGAARRCRGTRPTTAALSHTSSPAPQQQRHASLLSQAQHALGLPLAATSAVALLLLSPGTAAAVSGGGGGEGLAYQDLSNRDLTKLRLTKADLRKAKFDGSNLAGVSLFAALAKDASFVGTNLTGADLESGYFEDADFTNAVLEGAYVNNAQFINVKIAGTDWTDVVMRRDMQKQLCAIASGTNPTTGVDTRESLNCS